MNSNTINVNSYTISQGNKGLTPFRRLWRMLSLDKREILTIYAYAIFSGLINLSLPLGVQAIIGFIISAEFSASWGLLIFVVVLGVAVSGVIQVLQLTLTEVLQRRIFTRASFEFAYRIPRFKGEFMEGLYAPELVNRFFDTLTLQKGLSKLLVDFSGASLQILFGLMLLSFYHPFFVFFGLFLVALIALIFWYSGPKGLQSSIMESSYKYKVAYWLEELARVMSTFKLAGVCKLPLDRTNEFVDKYLTYRKEHFKILVFQFSNIVAFKTLITAGVLILGSVLVINQEINLGQFVAAEIIILLVLSSVEKLILSMETVYDVLTGVEKMGQVTDLPIESDHDISAAELTKDNQFTIEMEEVDYVYPNSNQLVLNQLNLTMERGARVFIEGRPNSGKSTLAAILSGLLTNYRGRVYLNGMPLKDLDIQSYRTMVGNNIYGQDLFFGTFEDNLTLGYEVEPNKLLEVIDQVGLTSFYRSLDDGLATGINPQNQSITKASRQKIYIARILLAQPRMVVLDDGLAALGNADRDKILSLMVDPARDWTVVLLSRENKLAKYCNQHYRLQKGTLTKNTATNA